MSKFFYVQIAKSEKSNCWYNSYVGKVFKIYDKLEDFLGGPAYVIAKGDFAGHGIYPHDCFFVSETMYEKDSDKIKRSKELIEELTKLWNQ